MRTPASSPLPRPPWRTRWLPGALLLGPLLALSSGWLALPAGPAIAVTTAVTALCVVWWVFEPIPIAVTSLIPLAVFQLSGVLSKDAVAQAYGSPLILLLLGGFILSKAMERSGAHRRLALFMVNAFGGHSSRSLVLGFMVSAALLSMWISNTATTLMLLPVAMAVFEQSKDPKLGIPLMLGIAWAASIGGMGTPIGTPPNLVFMQVYEQNTGANVGFAEWMSWGVPVVVLLIPLAWWWLTRSLDYRGGYAMPEVGRWSPIEKRVMAVFALTALAWITRKEPFGGWSEWLGLQQANDASVALLAVVLMFVIPAGETRGGIDAKPRDGHGGDNDRGQRHTERLLDWETAARIPWGVLLLFGGGICLAKAFGVSGLSAALASHLSALSSLPVIAMILLISLAVTFLTETTSNTASTVLLMPVLAATALGTDIDPRLLMVPAAMSASCAFMMPVATAPNSIVYGSGCLSTRDMASRGLVMNLIAAPVVTLVCFLMLVS